MKYFKLNVWVCCFLLQFNIIIVHRFIYGLEKYNTAESDNSFNNNFKRNKRFPMSAIQKKSADTELESNTEVDSDSFLKELENGIPDEIPLPRRKSPYNQPPHASPDQSHKVALPAKISQNRRTNSAPRRAPTAKKTPTEPLSDDSLNDPAQTEVENEFEYAEEPMPSSPKEEEDDEEEFTPKPVKPPEPKLSKSKTSKSAKSKSPVPAESETERPVHRSSNRKTDVPKKTEAPAKAVKVERQCSSSSWSFVANSIIDVEHSNGSISIGMLPQASVDSCALRCCTHENCSNAVFSTIAEVWHLLWFLC